MAHLLTPPPEGPPKIDDEREKLVTRLDELLELYLELLDDYIRTREQASSYFSSGYMSLAQANFNSGNRFGQDYYDERMQATRKVSMHVEEDVVSFMVSVSKSEEHPSKHDPEKPEQPQEPSKDESETPEPTAPESHKEDSDNPTPDEKPSESTEPPKPKSLDPIRWFGILVPSALRSAQTTFVKTVEGPIPRLATLSKELRAMEIEIGRARKRIRKLEGR